jgi:hypothetical protein
MTAGDDAVTAHGRDCGSCAAHVAGVRALLDGAAVPPMPSAWATRVVAAARPVLERRAEALFWRQLARVLVAALLPLPAIVLADLWMLGRAYALIAAWLPASIAAYFVLSYAATLVVLLSGVYAAIPLLLARPARAAAAAPA